MTAPDTYPTWRFRRPRRRLWLSGGNQPRYRLPLVMLARVAWSGLRGRPRDVRRDTSVLEARIRPRPTISGLEHLPRRGPCAILPNHYERPDGVWVGWGAIAITAALARQRPMAPPVRWVMTSTWQDCYFGPRHIPARRLRWILRRFAVVYDLILMPAEDEDIAGRGAALRQLFRAFEAPSGQFVALHPEAGGFETMIQPPPGIGRVLAGLDRRGIPCVPVGVYEQDGRLIVRIGEPLPRGLLANMPDRQATDAVMRAIATLVPPATRGVFLEVVTPVAAPASAPAAR